MQWRWRGWSGRERVEVEMDVTIGEGGVGETERVGVTIYTTREAAAATAMAGEEVEGVERGRGGVEVVVERCTANGATKATRRRRRGRGRR